MTYLSFNIFCSVNLNIQLLIVFPKHINLFFLGNWYNDVISSPTTKFVQFDNAVLMYFQNLSEYDIFEVCMFYFWRSKHTTIGSFSIIYQSIFLGQLIQWSNQFTNKKIVCIVWQWYNHAFSEFKRIWHIWGFYVLFLENQLYTYWEYFQNVSIYFS